MEAEKRKEAFSHERSLNSDPSSKLNQASSAEAFDCTSTPLCSVQIQVATFTCRSCYPRCHRRSENDAGLFSGVWSFLVLRGGPVVDCCNPHRS